MKHFIRNIMLAVFCTVPHLVLLVFVHRVTVNTYHQNISLKPEQKIIITSDSQTAVSLNPVYFPELANFSYCAISLQRSYLKMVDVVRQNPGKVKVLLVDVSPDKLFNSTDKRLTSKDPMSSILNPRWTDWSNVGNLVIYLIDRSKALWLERNKQGIDPYAGGFEAISTQLYIINPQLANSLEDQFSSKFNRYPDIQVENCFSVISVDYICRMIEYAQQQKITVILMTSPLKETFVKKHSTDKMDVFEKTMNRIAQKYAVVWLNYLNRPFAIENWADPLHLNNSAVQTFSTCVRQDVLKVWNPRSE